MTDFFCDHPRNCAGFESGIGGGHYQCYPCKKIERLTAEGKRMREALAIIADHYIPDWHPGLTHETGQRFSKIAYKALAAVSGSPTRVLNTTSLDPACPTCGQQYRQPDDLDISQPDAADSGQCDHSRTKGGTLYRVCKKCGVRHSDETLINDTYWEPTDSSPAPPDPTLQSILDQHDCGDVRFKQIEPWLYECEGCGAGFSWERTEYDPNTDDSRGT